MVEKSSLGREEGDGWGVDKKASLGGKKASLGGEEGDDWAWSRTYIYLLFPCSAPVGPDFATNGEPPPQSHSPFTKNVSNLPKKII